MIINKNLNFLDQSKKYSHQISCEILKNTDHANLFFKGQFFHTNTIRHINVNVFLEYSQIK